MSRHLPGLRLERRDAVLLVTLDRPAQLNGPDRAMHAALVDVWAEVDEASDVRAVVLTGSGRGFTSGSDRSLIDSLVVDERLRREVIAEAGQLLRTMADVRVPLVAAVNGPAIGLGCAIVALCDVVLIGERGYLADPHVALGLCAGDGGALLWPLLTGTLLAKEHVLLGDRIDAETAVRIGLATRVVGDDELVDEAVAVASRLADAPPQAVRATRAALQRRVVQRLEHGTPLAASAELESFSREDTRAALRDAMSRFGT